MKYSLLIIFLIGAASVFGQKNIHVETVKENMSKGLQPGYSVDIPQASLETVKKSWISHIQQSTKAKPGEEGHEVIIMGAVDKEIDPNPFNLYSILLNKDSSVHLVAFFEIDSGSFFDPSVKTDDLVSSKVDLEIRDYLQDFAIEQYTEAVKLELEGEEDALKSLNKELKSLKSEQEKLEKGIKSSEQKISSANDEIKMLNVQTEAAVKQIEAARLNTATITDKDANKAAKKELNSMEKEKKKLDNEKEKQEKAIVGHQTDIKESETAIETLIEKQEELSVKINALEENIKSVELKLKSIQ